MMLSGAALGLVLAAAAARPLCLHDGDTVPGQFKWMSLTRPNGKPIPAPYLALDLPVCLRDKGGVHFSHVLRLQPADPTALEGLNEGDVLTVWKLDRLGRAHNTSLPSSMI